LLQYLVKQFKTGNQGANGTMHRTFDNFDIIGLMIAAFSLIRIAVG